jgi:hypothetical protein
MPRPRSVSRLNRTTAAPRPAPSIGPSIGLSILPSIGVSRGSPTRSRADARLGWSERRDPAHKTSRLHRTYRPMSPSSTLADVHARVTRPALIGAPNGSPVRAPTLAPARGPTRKSDKTSRARPSWLVTTPRPRPQQKPTPEDVLRPLSLRHRNHLCRVPRIPSARVVCTDRSATRAGRESHAPINGEWERAALAVGAGAAGSMTKDERAAAINAMAALLAHARVAALVEQHAGDDVCLMSEPTSTTEGPPA